MRKFTILLTLVALASTAMAQVKSESGFIKNTRTRTQNAAVVAKEVIPAWEVTFEEAVPTWIFGSTVGAKSWSVDAAASTNAADYMGEVNTYSESGSKFAWVEGITDLINANPYAFDTYIQFDNIDLTTVNNPKLTFFQNYKLFNRDTCYIDFSKDGGTTWTTIQVNSRSSIGAVNSYGEDYLEIIVGDDLANAANASIRFRWVFSDMTTSGTYNPAQYGMGYGWQLDDIKIVEVPDYDLKMTHGRTNFFEYYDYLDPQYADVNVYQMSAYYGNLPQAQFASEFGNMWFNVAVENKGLVSVTPKATVQIFDPLMASIFADTLLGNLIATNEIDTIDLIELGFSIGASPALGEYTIVYKTYTDGQDDFSPADNVDTAYFNITENFYSRDVNEPTNSFSLNNFSTGGFDGEMFGSTYMYLFETEITSLDVFIASTSTAGASIIAHIMQYDTETSSWLDISTTPLITLVEADLGTWKNFDFTDAVNIVFGTDETAKEVLVALEMYYNGADNEVWIGYDGYDYVDGTYNHGFYTKYDGDEAWYYGGLQGGLSLRLNMNGYQIGQDVANIVSENINIYPNPTNSSLNIENVKGADLQIVNMMGQVVETVINANEFNTIDMSAYANGTYFVKIIANNQVVTRKINLMK